MFAAAVDPQSYIGALVVDGSYDTACGAIEAVFCAVVAYVRDGAADYGGNIDITVGRDFTHDNYKPGGSSSFASYACHGIFCEYGVKHRVAYAVAHFVGMTFRDAF